MSKREKELREAWAAEEPLVLKKFQAALLDSLKGKRRVALYSGMGTGKTVTSLAKAQEIGTGAVLVVCQVTQVEQWLHNCLRQCKGYKVFNLRDKKEFEEFLLYKDKKIGVINYDLIWRKPELLKLRDFTMILDESSLVSNRSSKRTKFALKLSKNAAGLICCSATPVSGKYENLISQCWMLGWKVKVDDFWNEYVLYSTWSPPGTNAQIRQVLGYRNTEQLIEKLETVCNARFLRSEAVIDLPEENDITINIEQTPDYKKFLKNWYIQLKDGPELVGDCSLSRRIYLRELAGAYNPGKEQALEDLLTQTEDRIIIFYCYDEELNVIKRVCEKLNKVLAEMNGRAHELSKFEENEGCVFAIQYQSGARGLNLQICNKIIFFSPTDQCELYGQARGRIRRMGQTRPCFYYHLMTRGSIDEDIQAAVDRGQDYTEQLFVLQYPGRKIL